MQSTKAKLKTYQHFIEIKCEKKKLKKSTLTYRFINQKNK